MRHSKLRYVIGLFFGSVLIISLVYLLWIIKGIYFEFFSAGIDDWVDRALKLTTSAFLPIFTAIISAVGTISTVILAWRSEKRTAREQELKIAQLERDLEEIKQGRQLDAAKNAPATPTPKKKHNKKVR